MSLEDRLRNLRPRSPADALRPRVLAAVRGARREQRLWRWTWAVAAAVVVVAVPVNMAIDAPSAVPARPPAPDFAETADEGLRLRWRLAVTPRPGPFLPKETP